MTFKIYNKSYNLRDLIRKMGYRPLGYTPQGELNCVRPLGGDYPRFHIYVKDDKDIITFNIHLDQKKPIYEGVTAHSGDYDGDVVKDEVQRIKDTIFR
ncbi:MAG: hypothetical protein UY26_C0003G0223 [Candidatus Jorgensenbacteria bacterium GW2011_GWA1_48_13]|uniref:Uncharacterized protein n=1 Tax=Candidatus Jorgensenbacteria bacterium GW2011_GWB1_50_10 TaxID=1618665 RepID=A0A0G1W8X0_9BACT|nr:MAG: hypothetical protein UX26_C0020G0013 [Parcubacteria group bacterium GW2011_GWC1_45_9]KKU94073.1 MAG: hypothetical protein UY26_C0003G0223 [Candidatus Jorgensenbacteria bacterium GW2011_GWA1_48_13]KKW15178.1 MAG: hypothetical protein UY55_C0002G0236 [Candidatus Jorgensenbacteria bacterium GW2011_GWB1_50_10]